MGKNNLLTWQDKWQLLAILHKKGKVKTKSAAQG